MKRYIDFQKEQTSSGEYCWYKYFCVRPGTEQDPCEPCLDSGYTPAYFCKGCEYLLAEIDS